MKKSATIFIFLLITFLTAAQSNEWPQDFEKVVFDGTSQKPIIIYFSGSDWCKPCIKFMDEILTTNEFYSYAQKFNLYQADFPYRKKQEKEHKKFNELLAEKYNKEGLFPKFIVVDPKGLTLFESGYKPLSVAEFIALIEKSIIKK